MQVSPSDELYSGLFLAVDFVLNQVSISPLTLTCQKTSHIQEMLSKFKILPPSPVEKPRFEGQLWGVWPFGVMLNKHKGAGVFWRAPTLILFMCLGRVSF